jgi:hypothetical protein
MTIYKPAGLFASASQRRFAPTIAGTPVEVYERCYRLPLLEVALAGISGYGPAFLHRSTNVKKT